MPATTRAIDHHLLRLADIAASGDPSGAEAVIGDLGLTLFALVAAEQPRYPAGTIVDGENVGGKWMPKAGATGGAGEDDSEEDGFVEKIATIFDGLYKKSKVNIEATFEFGQDVLDGIDSFLDGLPKIQIPDISERLPEVFKESAKKTTNFVNKKLKELDYSDLAVFLLGTACIVGPEAIITAMIGNGINAVFMSLVETAIVNFATNKFLDAAKVENHWVRLAVSMALGIGLGHLCWKATPVKAGTIAKQVKELEAKGKGIVTDGFAFPSEEDFSKAFLRPLKTSGGTSKFYVAQVGETHYFLKAKSYFGGDAIGRSAAVTDIAKALDIEDATIPFKKVVIDGKEYGVSPFMPVESINELSNGGKDTRKLIKGIIKKDPERVKKLSLLEFIGGNADNHGGNVVIDSGGKLRLIDFDAAFIRGREIGKKQHEYMPLNPYGISPLMNQAKDLQYTRAELQLVVDREAQIRKCIRQNLEAEERTTAYKLARAQVNKIKELLEEFDDANPPKILDLQMELNSLADKEAAKKVLDILNSKGETFLRDMQRAIDAVRDDLRRKKFGDF